jgi:hypothetical protein
LRVFFAVRYPGLRVDALTIEKIWSRFIKESRPIFSLQMEDGDFTAIDLYGGPGAGHVLRSDGVIARWEYETFETPVKYQIEPDPGCCIGAIAIASERIPEFRDVLPVRPEGARDCDICSGQGFTDLPGAPKFLLCQLCWGWAGE